jgi:DNA-binding transcriptional LysR family regulator
MFTLKQLEALVWVVRLGGFAQAADHLRTTQSTVSKRVNELEERLRVQVFDRSARSATLTEKGRELVFLGEELLLNYERVVERVSAADVVARDLRIGVTELTALTWLPRLIEELAQQFPHVSVEHHVADSASLFDGLDEEKFDVVIAADIPDRRQSFIRRPVGTVDNGWMCASHLREASFRGKQPDLSNATVLILRGERSGSWVQHDNWLQQHRIDRRQIRYCSNLISQIGLTIGGLGISYLPLEALDFQIAAGRLSVLDIGPRLSGLSYVAVTRSDRESKLNDAVVELAKTCCDYSRLFFDTSLSADKASPSDDGSAGSN